MKRQDRKTNIRQDLANVTNQLNIITSLISRMKIDEKGNVMFPKSDLEFLRTMNP